MLETNRIDLLVTTADVIKSVVVVVLTALYVVGLGTEVPPIKYCSMLPLTKDANCS